MTVEHNNNTTIVQHFIIRATSLLVSRWVMITTEKKESVLVGFCVCFFVVWRSMVKLWFLRGGSLFLSVFPLSE